MSRDWQLKDLQFDLWSLGLMKIKPTLVSIKISLNVESYLNQFLESANLNHENTILNQFNK